MHLHDDLLAPCLYLHLKLDQFMLSAKMHGSVHLSRNVITVITAETTHPQTWNQLMIQAQDMSLSSKPSVSHTHHWFSGRFALLLGLSHTAGVCLVVLMIATLVG